MNNTILNLFKNDDINRVFNVLLKHQLATIDFLIKKVYREKENVLLYHDMGSGKTILSIIFSLIISNYKKILIVVPNNSIHLMWLNQFNLAKLKDIELQYNMNNINIISKTKFISQINEFENEMIKKIKLYDDYIIIIDEAHNYFGNNSGVNIKKIKRETNSNFILLSGSPISNTVEPLEDIILLLKNIEFNNKYIVKGDKVYDTYLTNEGLQYVKKILKGNISYYKNKVENVPDLYFIGKQILHLPIIDCPMSDLQNNNYLEIKNEINNNEMFIKDLLNVSFCALGTLDNYKNIQNLLNTNTKLLPNLYIAGQLLGGSELIDLNISSKLKYYRNKYISNLEANKKFIYFSNSKIGSIIIRSVMMANGISEINKNIVPNFRCSVCNLKRTCLPNCFPCKFCIITSNDAINNNYINDILTEYNDIKNKEGKYLMFLFGSKIISEGYTTTEVKYITYLTIPDTYTNLSQITSRAIRAFSYSNIKDTNVELEILVATTKNNKIVKELLKNKKIEKYKNLDLNNMEINDIKYKDLLNNNDIDYDIKKLLYLEIKFNNIDNLLSIFRSLHNNYESNIDPLLNKLILKELNKRYFYNNILIHKDDIIKKFKNFDKKDSLDIINSLDGSYIYNKIFGPSVIVKKNKEFILYPIMLNQVKYFMFIEKENII